MYVTGEGLGKTSMALSSGLTHFFWLISCRCHPRMYATGKGLGNIFIALSHAFTCTHPFSVFPSHICPNQLHQ